MTLNYEEKRNELVQILVQGNINCGRSRPRKMCMGNLKKWFESIETFESNKSSVILFERAEDIYREYEEPF